MSMRRPETTTEVAAPLKWSELSETERSAASLGVSPEHWKPIAFMNDAHYETLLKTNAIDGELAKKLEAFKHVASGEK
jgi:hypothetical protein